MCHQLDELGREARPNQFGRPPTAIDQQHQQPVDFGVAEPQLALIGLADPQVAGSALARIGSGTPRCDAN